MESRYRISTQLYLSIGAAVTLTVAACLVGWFSFIRVGSAQNQVTEESVPEVVAAFGIAQHSGTLVNAAPLLTAAATPEELAAISAEINWARESLEEHLSVILSGTAQAGESTLSNSRIANIFGIAYEEESAKEDILFMMHHMESADGTLSERIRAYVDTLTVGISAIESEMAEIFEIHEQEEVLIAELEALRIQIDEIMAPTVDDQLFYTMTGFRTIGVRPVARDQHFSDAEIARYRNLAGLHTDAITAIQILESSFNTDHSTLIEPLRERFESVSGSIDRNLSALEGFPMHPEVIPMLTRLRELGMGENNGFDLHQRHLEITHHQQDIITLNQGAALALVEEVNTLVNTARSSAEEATQASDQAMRTGLILLFVISIVSIIGALLIAWLFIGRFLLRRLEMLSDRMLIMAGGNLETKVEMSGRDEVAEMAAALEVFRLNSLEAQRLNLVEQLAEELQGKNEELEHVLNDLERAQDQIVMREKLAALGELTAGVAHEIRNPLNFVKNFSESSEELLEELEEILVDVGDDISEEDRGYIQEISGDLVSNLERIRTHGDRANRIVNDMLMMGRDTGEQRSTDINSLLDEHTRLAYHSARALDPNFQLDIKQDLDPNMGEVEVVPRDLGRVFLNLVGNACDATDEKRRRLETELRDGETYMPTLSVSTLRNDEQIEIRIKDNGSGMPPDVVEKIFNPFFTTKSTDKGTGLGLAISSDIVRQHGGTIKVDSKPDEYTEMTIELPLVTPLVEIAQ